MKKTIEFFYFCGILIYNKYIFLHIESKMRMKKVRFSLIVTFALALLVGIMLRDIGHSGFTVTENSDAFSSYTDEIAATAAPQDNAEAGTNTAIVSGKININTADLKTLTELDGIGENLAKRIIDYRSKHGKFETVEQIMKVSGIGKKRFGLIKDYIIAE